MLLQAKNEVLSSRNVRSIGDLLSEFADGLPAGVSGCSLAIVCDRATEQIGAAAWLAANGNDGLLLSTERLTRATHLQLLDLGFHVLVNGRLDVPRHTRQPQEGRISLLSSGTTGPPKIVAHTWATLNTMSKVRFDRSLNWLVTYQPGTYAWYQVLLAGLSVPGQRLTVSDDRTPAALAEVGAACGVTAVSGTPSFWRFASLQCSRTQLRGMPLQQITLGGERVDQQILNEIRSLYPSAALTHIYASTEVGACIVVRDGLEGFPAEWLGDEACQGSNRGLKISEGRLWIRSPHASPEYQGWIDTRDAVELWGNRVVIVGRSEHSVINVGGTKVGVYDVERCLLDHQSILWCRAHGVKAPLIGEVVAIDFVFRPGEPPVEERELIDFISRRLPPMAVPRFWNLLDSVPITPNFKSELAS